LEVSAFVPVTVSPWLIVTVFGEKPFLVIETLNVAVEAGAAAMRPTAAMKANPSLRIVRTPSQLLCVKADATEPRNSRRAQTASLPQGQTKGAHDA